MIDEFIDILDPNGEFTGDVRLKSEAHRLGLYHASVHIWFYTKDKQLLIQKRARHKDTYPNLWDISVAGHISSGESKEDTALREIKEEIGLSVSKNNLEFIGVHLAKKQPTIAIIDNEFHYIYLSKLDTSLKQLTLQKEEVCDIVLVSIKVFEKEIKHPTLQKKYVPHGTIYYDFILKEIRNRIL